MTTPPARDWRPVALGVALVAVVLVVVVSVLTRGEDDAGSASPSGDASAAADGTGETASTESRVEDFCGAYRQAAAAYGTRVAGATDEASLAAVQDAVDDWSAISEQLRMSADERAGFETFAAGLAEQPATATPAQQAAFSAYLDETCPSRTTDEGHNHDDDHDH